MEDQWMAWAQRLSAMAQTGLTFADNPYDTERYHELRQIAAQMIAHRAGAEPARIEAILALDPGYATPRVDVRGVVFRDDRILLVREKADGLWTLPGGWADVGDTPSSAVVREIREESGLETQATKLLAVLDRNSHPHPPHIHHIYKLFILCELRGGTLAPAHDILDAAFFAEADIPPLSLCRVLPEQIHRMFEHHRNPTLPADLD